MEPLRFSIPGPPFGKQRPRFASAGGRVVAYTPDETASYESMVRMAYLQSAGGFMFPDGAAIEAWITAYYAVPKSASRKKREAMLGGAARPTKKPDWDNIGKVVCDSLNGVAYRDDSAIVEARVSKGYSETPRVEVVLMEAGEFGTLMERMRRYMGDGKER